MTYKERYSPAIPFIPYLQLSIKSSEYRINEGYIYSQEERKIHGFHIHGGVDFDCSFGTPVLAAASGLAVATYHRFVLRNTDGSLRLYNGKPLGFGFGYMVQIYHDNKITLGTGNRITQYGHLSQITDILPKFLPPKVKPVTETEKKLAEEFPWIQSKYGFTHTETDKEIYGNNFDEIIALHKSGSPYVTYVEQGQQIGNVGNSGLLVGNNGQVEASESVTTEKGVPELTTWDSPHLHFEEATRDSNGLKIQRRDPFNIYLSRKWYQKIVSGTLFLNA
jgi:hypothetical protein